MPPTLIGYDMAIVPQVLGAARDASGAPLYDVRLCGLEPGQVDTPKGYAVVLPHGPEALAWAETVVVPGTRYAEARAGRVDAALRSAWDRVRPGTRIVSICTGAFVLASLGILDGLRATTHWEHADVFAELFPQVDLDPGVLFVDEGDVLTSAGLGAGVDLCLHLIRRDHGIDAASGADRLRSRIRHRSHIRPWVVVPWRDNPWSNSTVGAGVPSAGAG